MPLPKPKAILLDLDDTILEYGAHTRWCWDALCDQFAPGLNIAPEALRTEIWAAHRWLWGDVDRHRIWRNQMGVARAEIVRMALKQLNIEKPELPAQLSSAFGPLLFQRMTLFPGALETLEYFRGQGIPLALLTNGSSEPQRAKINKFALARFFDCILIEGEFGVGKPDARVYQHALAQLGAQPHEAWMVGDNFDWEVIAPKVLGLNTVWVDVRRTGPPTASPIQPDHVVQNISELQQLVKSY